MQSLNSVINKIQAGHSLPSIESSSEHAQRGFISKFAWRLWDRMTEIYGHKWVSSYGEEPNAAWCGIIDGLEAEQIKRGLTALLESDDPWPPTAIRFRQLCLGQGSNSWERQCHRIFEPERLLEDVTAKELAREAGASALADMKKLFAGVRS
ncbi:MAG: hypothetical protein ACK5MR_16320 [Cumulibacter sp.]